jgi:NAD(P)-dependent dehydrogenase (short-subunit alcohol dehydrogenase family)
MSGGMLVIGPAGRLARATAHAARDRGACVALAAPDGGEDTSAGMHSCLSMDIGSEAAAEELFDRAALVVPDLETVIVVSPAPPLAPVHQLSRDQWRVSVEDPLRRVFWLVRRAVEGFLGDGVDGRIVLVVENRDETGSTNHVVAAALQSLVRSFAREYGRRGLACNLVVRAQPHLTSPMSPISPIIEQVLFLASPAASFVNGETLVVR